MENLNALIKALQSPPPAADLVAAMPADMRQSELAFARRCPAHRAFLGPAWIAALEAHERADLAVQRLIRDARRDT